jgi:hypothetical protein
MEIEAMMMASRDDGRFPISYALIILPFGGITWNLSVMLPDKFMLNELR